jgi:membrane-associated phospholipid phosphatase
VIRKNFLIAFLVSAAYLLVSYFLVGFKSDQVLLILFFSIFYVASVSTRKFILAFSIFIVYWVIFDYMKAFPNYQFSEVHIRSLHDNEVSLFGISSDNDLLSPSEYWQKNHTTLLDIVSGFFYLTWVPFPLAFAVYLFIKNREQFLKFSLTFFLVNMIGFVIYYLYPAAPPWYPMQFGLEFIPQTPGNTAGLARFDQFFNINLFASIYAKSSNVFAAMPSLHSSYPLIGLYYAARNKLKILSMIFAITMFGIWFAAIYTGHHYVLDVLAGMGCGILGILIFNTLVKRSKGFRKFLDRYLLIIS